MAETVISWGPRSAWSGVAQPGSFGAQGETGVVATLLDGLGLATVIAAPNGSAALSRAFEARLGLARRQRRESYGARLTTSFGPARISGCFGPPLAKALPDFFTSSRPMPR